MKNRLVLVVAVLVVVLVAVAALVTLTQYKEPRGAAAGGAAGCGGEAVHDEPEVGHEEALEQGANDPDAPSQITYSKLEGEQPCLKITLEPLDAVASVEDLCGSGQIKAFDLDTKTAAAVLSGYYELLAAECGEGECGPGERVEVLTVKEETRVLPYESPLSDQMEKVLELYQEESETAVQPESDPPPAAPPKEVTLQPEQGVVFAGAQVETEASPLKVDVICYASSKTVDLQAGAGPTISKQKHLKLFKTSGGVVQKFNSLDEVPDIFPGSEDRDMVHHAEAGMAFVVENNVSAGYTKAIVTSASKEAVVLEYTSVP